MTVTMTRSLLVGLAGAALAAIGAFLPWITATTFGGTISRSGLDGGGDGLIMLGAALVAAIALLTAKQLGPALTGVAGAAVLGLGIIDLNNVQEKLKDPALKDIGSTGAGLYVCLFGGALLIVSAWMAWQDAKAAAPVPPPPANVPDAAG